MINTCKETQNLNFNHEVRMYLIRLISKFYNHNLLKRIL